MTQKVISFHYSVSDASGKVVDSSLGKAPLTFMQGAGQIIPGLESQLAVLLKGDKKKISVAAEDAYGQRNESLLVKVPKSKLPADSVKVGDRFRGGEEFEAPVFTVLKIEGEEVTLDGNHPLAGQALVFDVEVTEVREATAQEVQHGHAHGAHGHDH